MKPIFAAPAELLLRKPPHGQPCTRCGLCCIATLCPLARVVFGDRRGACPALSFDADRNSSCGLVDDPTKHAAAIVRQHGVDKARETAKHLIGSMTGCDARFNGEEPDQSFYAKLDEHDRKTRSETLDASRVWGMDKAMIKTMIASQKG